MNAPFPKTPADRVIPIRGEEWPLANLGLAADIRAAAPPFPLDLLGPFWSRYVEEASAGACAPVDYVAAALLTTVGAVIGNVRWPRVHARWSEPPILWSLAVGTPSDGKSPALRQVSDLLRSVERDLAKDHDDDLLLYEGQKVHAEALREDWKRTVKEEAKKGPAGMMPKNCAEPVKPERPRFRIVDTTPESAAAVAAVQPRGLILSLDEVSTWVNGFGRYSKGSGGADAERMFWIEAHQGAADRTVDRKGGSFTIPNLSVAVVGSIQPAKFGVILGGANDGFAARFLWAWPDRFPEFAIPKDDFGSGGGFIYERAISRLIELKQDTSGDKPRPVCLPLSAGAEALFVPYTRDKRELGREQGASILGAITGKAPGTAIRLACILDHLWWCAEPVGREPAQIGERAMAAALVMLDDYFLPQATRVLGEDALSEEERAAVVLVRWVKVRKLKAFNVRDLYRTLGIEPPAMNAACALLAEAGIFRAAPSRAGGSAGRKANNYDVNPALWAVTDAE